MALKELEPREEVRWPEQGEWTYEDWVRLPGDGFRYEVLDGVLYVMPPPTVEHQNSLLSLAMRMRQHAEANELGLVLTAPIGVRLAGQEVPVEPDILFVTKHRNYIVGKQYIEGAPDLIVEVLSPSNWAYDRKTKQEIYRKAGVEEYWLVDYRLRIIDVLLLEGEEYVQQGRYGIGDEVVSTVLAGFKVAVADVFAH